MANALINVPNFDSYDVSSMRNIMIGGAASSPELDRAHGAGVPMQLLRRLWAQRNRAGAHDCQDASREWNMTSEQDRLRRTAMAGWPVPDVEMRVVDCNGNDVRAGHASDRRDRRARRSRHVRLLQRSRSDRGRHDRRLVPYRRHGRLGRRRIHPHRRPQEGDHHQRRRKHLVASKWRKRSSRTRRCSNAP